MSIQLRIQPNGIVRVPEDTCDKLEIAKGGQDVYLFVGSQLPVIGPKIRAAGYDPDNPTPEGIKNAKKECKTERQISKTVVLASSYGAGPAKLHRTLTLAGIDIAFNIVEEIHAMYWEIYADIVAYRRWLESEWRKNEGWVVNGVGRPICVDAMFKKDLVNRVVQSTGHDILLKYIRIWSDKLDECGVEWYPIIADWHDQSIIEVREEDADMVKYIMGDYAFLALNEELKGIIPLKGTGGVVKDLAESKLEG